jgi:hypothetical protein
MNLVPTSSHTLFMKAMSRLDHQPYQNLQVGNIVSNGFDLVTFQQEIMSY